MANTLGPFLLAEIKQRGWSITDFSVKSTIPSATLSRMLNNPHAMPELRHLAQAADTLELPLTTLLEQLGFVVSVRRDTLEMRVHLAALAEHVPGLAPLLPALAGLQPEHQAAAIAYIEWIIARYGQDAEDDPKLLLALPESARPS